MYSNLQFDKSIFEISYYNNTTRCTDELSKLITLGSISILIEFIYNRHSTVW